jgi:hypothetical protein
MPESDTSLAFGPIDERPGSANHSAQYRSAIELVKSGMSRLRCRGKRAAYTLRSGA